MLFDELGAGTDPTEGAALAMSILTYLHNKNVHAMATTHYAELKMFALSTPGVSNACCEFDVETLSPTYRLLIGIPGKSNAFAISKKLGLTDDIIAMAESFIGTKDKSFEDIISGLEKSRLEAEKALDEAVEIRNEAAELRAKWQEKQRKLDNARDKVINEANEKARTILEEAKEYADESIRKLNKLGSNGGLRDMEKERTALRERLSEKNESLALKNNSKRKKKLEASDIKVGSDCMVLTFNVKGKILSLPNAKGDMTVSMGSMRTTVNIKDIELTDPEPEEKVQKKTGYGDIKMQKSMSVTAECNIIGMRVDEALPIVDKYLDDAYLARMSSVSIIHGRGTGALKDAVHSHLKRLKYVASYRLGNFGEGDTGVTIVTFKE